jgi:hypothetical protein
MNWKDGLKQLYLPLILLACIFFVSWFSINPLRVETYYYNGIYPFISGLLRIIFGWLPFSVGDILYTILGVWLLFKIVHFFKRLFKKQVSRPYLWQCLKKIISFGLSIYLIFYVCWGINYNRLGIAYQLHITPVAYSTATLSALIDSLVVKANKERIALPSTNTSDEAIFEEAKSAYAKVATTYPYLSYNHPAIKSSLFGRFGNYAGFLGYYNPFSGEAQVNTTIPRFLIPYTACHEIGHQLGYATEDEANFAGYLAASASNDVATRYSVYIDLFLYANGELYARDSIAAKSKFKQLDTLIKQDLHDYKTFLLAHQNPVEPYITLLYGEYLKANNQPQGMDTYDDVISWLIAYQKKYGKL